MVVSGKAFILKAAHLVASLLVEIFCVGRLPFSFTWILSCKADVFSLHPPETIIEAMPLHRHVEWRSVAVNSQLCFGFIFSCSSLTWCWVRVTTHCTRTLHQFLYEFLLRIVCVQKVHSQVFCWQHFIKFYWVYQYLLSWYLLPILGAKKGPCPIYWPVSDKLTNIPYICWCMK